MFVLLPGIRRPYRKKCYFCRRKNNMEDSLKNQGARQRLVRELQRKGISDAAVLEAFRKVPRHFFVPDFLAERAYDNQALPIACGQTISQPLTVAMQTQLLEVKPRLRVLEIGTGCGFQSAILHAMGAHVYTVERQLELYRQSMTRFRELGLHIAQKYGDGYAGWPEFAPYDRILVTCGAPVLPQALPLQLKVGGLLLVPVGEKEQQMLKVVRTAEGFASGEHGKYTFVPMLENKTR